MAHADNDRLLTYENGASVLNIATSTLREQSRLRPEHLRSVGPFNSLPWIKIGGRSVRIWWSELVAWIEAFRPEAERELLVAEPEVQVGLPPRARGRPSKARLALEAAERASQKAEAAARERDRRQARQAERIQRRHRPEARA